MSDRLKQIWKGFEDSSGRMLTGVNEARGLPEVEEEAPPIETLIPADYERPSEAALGAFRHMKAESGKQRKAEPARMGRADRILARRKQPVADTPVFDGDPDRSIQRSRPDYLDAVEKNAGRPLFSFKDQPRKRRWFSLGGKKR